MKSYPYILTLGNTCFGLLLLYELHNVGKEGGHLQWPLVFTSLFVFSVFISLDHIICLNCEHSIAVTRVGLSLSGVFCVCSFAGGAQAGDTGHDVNVIKLIIIK